MLTLNDQILWNYTDFESDNLDGDDTPILGSSWQLYHSLEKYTSAKGAELRNISIRSGVSFNYEMLGMEISSHFSLKGESSFWIFTRCGPLEYSGNDLETINIYTAIIKISKEDKSQKCFITMSVFVEDENNNKIFKTFCKRQLINITKEKNNYYFENDLCDFKIYMVDAGDEKISVRVFMNECKEENLICSDFFLPFNSKASIIVAGNGQSCNVRTLLCKPFVKLDGATLNDQRNCDCCLII